VTAPQQQEEQQTLAYIAAQAAVAAAAAQYAQSVAGLFSKPVLSLAEWLVLLRVVFPPLQQFRERSAALARQFYDEQRALFYPQLPRHEVLLQPTSFDAFVESMEPVRQKMVLPDSTPGAVAQFTLQFTRDVEIAGRRQIIEMVESDEDVFEELESNPARPLMDVNRPVQGWARVATGRETCAWCLMLVSRGPVYRSAKAGGSKFDDESSVAAYVSDAEIKKFMNEWHTGCDCKVIPVWDLAKWPGKDAQERAEQLWIAASKKASRELRNDPDKKYYSFGKPATATQPAKPAGWYPTTKNRETINQLRKMIEAGEVSSFDWAVLHQAA
jgi:hypothetical protein